MEASRDEDRWNPRRGYAIFQAESFRDSFGKLPKAIR